MRRQLLAHGQIQIILQRLAAQILEDHANHKTLVLVGLQPRGTLLCSRIAQILQAQTGYNFQTGSLDITFFRDDFRRVIAKANATNMPFTLEDKQVVLIDDVLFTGRSVRAALDAMNAFGRPASVFLLVLIDRLYTRQLPIQAQYTGKAIDSVVEQHVVAQWTEQGHGQDAVWLDSSKYKDI